MEDFHIEHWHPAATECCVRNAAHCEHRPVRRDTILSGVNLLQKQLAMFIAAPVRGE